MKNRLRDWFGGRGSDAPDLDGLAILLHQQGVSAEIIDAAMGRQISTHSRLASTLVRQGDLGEREALEALCRYRGLPGVCLRNSVIDLASLDWTEALALEQMVLPIRTEDQTQVVLACADPPNDSDLREYEIRFGLPVRPHLCLEFYLRRTILAAFHLLREHPESRYLLGEEVDRTPAPEARARLFLAVPEIEAPALPGAFDDPLPTEPSVLLGMAPSASRDRILDRLGQTGVRITVAETGPEVLRRFAAHPPAMIILEASLPGRSGIDILRRLGPGLRYRDCRKVLLSPGFPIGASAHLDTIENLEILEADAVDVDFPSLVNCVRKIAVFGQRRMEHQARVILYQGLVQYSEGNLPSAASTFEEALSLDPLLGEAHLWRARTHYALDSFEEAAEAFAMAYDLGQALACDIAHLAFIHQKQGNLRLAARFWQRSAILNDDPEVSSSFRAHAETLANPMADATRRPEDDPI